MGLMRRVESRVEAAVGVESKDVTGTERRRDRSKHESKPYVQPADLARTLAREMDDHKVARSSSMSACNRFSVYLCPADAEHLKGREEDLIRDLEHQLRKRARAKKYDLPGEISVRFVVDEDLRLGRFGIQAERFADGASASTPDESSAGSVAAPWPGLAAGAGAAASPSPRRVARTRSTMPAAPATTGVGSETRVIQPEEAARMGLAHQTFVLTSGNRVREFTKGRIVVGRAKDTDFRLDDPNVSRRHAAFYWENGKVMVEDLDSTNGTLVNGYPILSTPVKESDVVHIGGHKITLETR